VAVAKVGGQLCMENSDRDRKMSDKREKAYKDFCQLVKERMSKNVLSQMPTKTQKTLFTKFDCV
jgi:hypothetical protein